MSSRKSKRSRQSRRLRRSNKANWVAHVMETSDALDLEPGVFLKSSPRAIAVSLKTSADASRRRKGTSYQSAMSMISFHLNRGGRNIPPERRKILEQAKVELRKLYGRE